VRARRDFEALRERRAGRGHVHSGHAAGGCGGSAAVLWLAWEQFSWSEPERPWASDAAPDGTAV